MTSPCSHCSRGKTRELHAVERSVEIDTQAIQDLQALFRQPYEDPSPELAAHYKRLKPREFFNAGGMLHYSCSS